MAKKKPVKRLQKKSEATAFSYSNVYCLVLYNTGPHDGDEGTTFSVLMRLVDAEIDRIDRGEVDDGDLKALLVIRDRMDVEFEKGRDKDD
jgi:hypothetical protein